MMNVHGLSFLARCSLVGTLDQSGQVRQAAGETSSSMVSKHIAHTLDRDLARTPSREAFLTRHGAEDFLPLLAFCDEHFNGRYCLAGPWALLLHAWHMADRLGTQAEVFFPDELLSGLHEADSPSMCCSEANLGTRDDNELPMDVEPEIAQNMNFTTPAQASLPRVHSDASITSPDRRSSILQPKNWPMVIVVPADLLPRAHAVIQRDSRIQNASSLATCQNFLWGEDIFFDLDSVLILDTPSPCHEDLHHSPSRLESIADLPVYTARVLHDDFLDKCECLTRTVELWPDHHEADADLWLNEKYLQVVDRIEKAIQSSR